MRSPKFSMTLKCDVRVKYCFIFLSCDIDKCQKQGICDCFKPNCHRVLQLTTQTDHIINNTDQLISSEKLLFYHFLGMSEIASLLVIKV